MLEENKTVELTDEELEKVTGGLSPNADGYYVLNQYDEFKQSAQGIDNQSTYVVLQAVTTNNVNQNVLCCSIQAECIPPRLIDGYVTISFLSTLTYCGNYWCNPHEYYGY